MASTNTGTVNTSNDTRISADKKTGPCQVCKNPSTLKCGSCLNVFYCSAQHQKQDWKKHKADGGCRPLRLEQDDKQGRYWVASRNIKAGELILKELPAIVGPIASEKQLAICISCCTKLEPPGARIEGVNHLDRKRKSCRKCGWPVCGIDCERAPIHADNECPLFTSRSVKFPVMPPPPNEFGLRLDKGEMYHAGICLIRGLLLKSKNPVTWDKIMNLQVGTKRAEFAKSSRREKENIERVHCTIANAISEEFQVSDLGLQEDWVRLSRILETNKYELGRQEVGKPLDSDMEGLYVEGSLFNHSCIPNAFRNHSYSPSFELHIRAAVDIKKGEMITLNYYAETMLYGTEKRLEKTKFTSGFVCQCARCLDPTELGTYMSAIICDLCPEKGIMLPCTFQNPKEPYRCQTPGCKNTETRSSVADMLSICRQEISDDGSIEGLIRDATKLEEFISSLSGKILHPNHWLLLEAERGCWCAYQSTYQNNPEHLARVLLYARRRAEFTATTSPGISLELALLQHSVVHCMVLDMEDQGWKLSAEEAYERWKQISTWASDAMKYWEIDVEHTPPGHEISEDGKHLKEYVILSADIIANAHKEVR